MRSLIKHDCPRLRRRNRRGGYLYVAVMAISTIVAIIGLSAITVARAKLVSAHDERDRYEARILALSAVEYGVSAVNKNSFWRSTYVLRVGNWPSETKLGRGTMSVILVDPDGNLLDNMADPAILYGVGRVGNAVHVHRVQIETSGSKMKITPGSWQDADAP